ncbi:hypothetical protein AU468_12220 [Alkalispirochaeta sphaeroplastigenens]|uniref:Autoinducer 2 import system permease protein LsrC n=1 Tax=Alkalispirochaeta sphaeroplastigenens TaxID=1187066 RepID=A0A2S4JGW5_9SPIO|nr:hypothetical protein AU468_12220 [Alkalispirochaeta sphaeroplastigenens]
MVKQFFSLSGVTAGAKRFFLKGEVWRLSLLVMIALAAVITAVQPNYIMPYNLLVKLRTWLPLVLAAYGQTFVILGGGIDLSVGTMIALVNVTAVEIMAAGGFSGPSILLGFLCGIAAGLAAGAVNGFCVAYLRFQPIITTFATGIIWTGLALWIRPESGGGVPMELYDLYSGNFLFLPLVVWALAALFGLSWLLKKSSFGVHLKAVGGNAPAAFETGLPVARIRLSSYMICSVFVSLASFCILGETITGNPYAGQGYDLESISAVALGGTSLAGGIGGPLGSIFGAAILKLVNDAIFFLGIPVNFQRLMQGLILVGALAAGGLLSKKNRGNGKDEE